MTRALIETYEALFYIAIDKIDAEERDFRINFWKPHSEDRRKKLLNLIESKNSALVDVAVDVENLHKLVVNHPFLNNFPDLRSKIQKREYQPFHLNQSQRNQRASIDDAYYKAIYMQLSAHLHTHPFSVHQLIDFRASNPECIRLMTVAVHYSTAFLVKAILGLQVLFGPRIPEEKPSVTNILFLWNELVSRGAKGY